MDEYHSHLEMLAWQIANKNDWRAVEQVPYLLNIIDCLPYTTRKIIEYKLEGYTVYEISEMCEISQGAVRMRLCRAKKVICRSLVG